MIKRQHMPKIYLGFTVKPNIYGSIAAHINGIAVVNNIGGLGFGRSGAWPNGWCYSYRSLIILFRSDSG